MQGAQAPPTRRRLLQRLAGWLGVSALGASGTRFASARPSAEGATEPVQVSLEGVAPGGMLKLEWDGKPVFVRRRTPEEIERERAVPVETLRDPQSDEARVKRPEWVVVEGICTHGGCIPNGPLGDFGGWYCLCHGSQFDTVGRVRAGPARENLKIPPYEFVGKLALRVGEGT